MCWKVGSDFAKRNEQALGFVDTEARENEEIVFGKEVLKSSKWKTGNAWSEGDPQHC